MAILFGTNSPNTKVKYDNTIVIIITKILSNTEGDIQEIFIILRKYSAK